MTRLASACSGLMYRSVPRMSPVMRQAGLALQPGQAEVGDPEVAADVEQEVGGLDVAVQHPLLVGVLQGLGGLDAQAGGVLEEGPAAGRPARGGQRCGAGAGRAADGATSAANEAVGSRASGPGWVASSGTEASPVASAKARSFSAEGLSAP